MVIARNCTVRPRAQSRGTCVALEQGHGPVGHGVSTVRSGHRHALGLVFHDA